MSAGVCCDECWFHCSLHWSLHCLLLSPCSVSLHYTHTVHCNSFSTAGCTAHFCHSAILSPPAAVLTSDTVQPPHHLLQCPFITMQSPHHLLQCPVLPQCNHLTTCCSAQLITMQHLVTVPLTGRAERLMAAALYRMRNGLLSRAWERWQEWYQEMVRQAEIVRQALARLMHKKLYDAFFTWASWCASQRTLSTVTVLIIQHQSS